LAASLFLSGCAPVFSDFQSGELVPPHHVEVTPSFAPVWFSEGGDTEHIQYNFGAQAAFGAHKYIELRAGYARLELTDSGNNGLNAAGFGPKVRLADQAALYLPVGFAFGNGVDIANTWEVHPTLLYTAVLSDQVQITPSGKALVPIGSGDRRQDTLLAFNVGAGLGPNLDQWMIRPEVGALFNPGESGLFWTLGIGFSYRFGAE
jgi:hypothetical protein